MIVDARPFVRERLEESVFDRLGREGAVSLPLLTDACRRHLVAAAAAMPFRPARPVVGGGDRVVYQDMAVSDAFVPGDAFDRLAGALSALVEAAARRLPAYPFASPLALDDLMLQRYRAGAGGITPHRDGWRYVNLVCLITLAGHARFALCDDRAGRNPRPLDAAPGRLIAMRAPGFAGSDARPFHLVDRITEPRLSLGLRQRRPAS